MIDKNYDWAYSEHVLYDDGHGEDAIDDLPCALHVHRFGKTEHYEVIGHDLLRFVATSSDYSNDVTPHGDTVLLDVNVDDIDALLNTPFA